MSLTLYNTFSKKEEEFVPQEKGKVRMYTCGPTVYGRPHIGNYASFLMADLLRRWLEVSGYEVTHVKNITDVGHLAADRDDGEDKVEKRAREEKVDPLTIAEKYTEQYLEDERVLRILEPKYRPRATETIPEMIAIIQELRKRGHAYETSDGIYFSVESFPDYGKLSGNTLENLHAGIRIEVNEAKKHPADFALWKKTVGENAHHILRWKFPSGERVHTEGDDPSAGFPGWHIECSAMAKKFLGEEIDIHTGGEDNIFPHHECEIAQSECSGPKPFVRMWLHKRRIDIKGEKMSKSLGNVLSLSDIIDRGYSPLDLRYYFLSVHYRTNLKFSWEGLNDAQYARKRIVGWMSEVNGDSFVGIASSLNIPTHLESEFTSLVDEYEKKFDDAMNDDLNVSAALAAIHEFMAASRNASVWTGAPLHHLQQFAKKISQTFGCFEYEIEEELPDAVKKLCDMRKKARADKEFSKSDELRNELLKLGYEVRDTSGGQILKKL